VTLSIGASGAVDLPHSLALDRARILVFAQALERRLSQQPTRRPFRECDLRDQHRPHPVHTVGAQRRRSAEGRRIDSQTVELLAQLPQTRLVEAGADTAGVIEPAVGGTPRRPAVRRTRSAIRPAPG